MNKLKLNFLHMIQIGVLVSLGGCAMHSEKPTISLEGDSQLTCDGIKAAYDELSSFGEDAHARKNQLDKLAHEKECLHSTIRWNISATFYAD